METRGGEGKWTFQWDGKFGNKPAYEAKLLDFFGRPAAPVGMAMTQMTYFKTHQISELDCS